MTMLTDIGGSTPIIQTGGADGMMGGSNWIWAFLLFALLGRGGFGGFGDGGTNPIYASQQFNQLDNGIRGIQSRIADTTALLGSSIKDGTYQTAMSIQGVNNNLGDAICAQTYELANQIRNLGERVDSCCCGTQRAIDGVNYNNERNANAIIQAGNTNTQRILDYLIHDKISDKDQKIFEMSQRAQTQEIINAQKPQAAIPAYIQPSPYEAYYPNRGGLFNSGYNFGYGC